MAESREKTVLEIGYDEATLDRLKAKLQELAQVARPIRDLTGTGGGGRGGGGGGGGGGGAGTGGGGGSGGGGGGGAGGGVGGGRGGEWGRSLGRAAGSAIGVAGSGSPAALLAGGSGGLGSLLGNAGSAVGAASPGVGAALQVGAVALGSAGAAMAGGYLARQAAFKEYSATRAAMAPLAAVGGRGMAEDLLTWGPSKSFGYSPQEASSALQNYLRASGSSGSAAEGRSVLNLMRYYGIGPGTTGQVASLLQPGGGLAGSSFGPAGLAQLFGGFASRLGIGPGRTEEFLARIAGNTARLAERGIQGNEIGLGTDLLALRGIDKQAFGGFQGLAAQERLQSTVQGAGQGFGLGLFPKQAQSGLLLAYAMRQPGVTNIMEAAEWLEQASSRPEGSLAVLRGAADQAGLRGVVREGYFSAAAGNVRQGRLLANGEWRVPEREEVSRGAMGRPTGQISSYIDGRSLELDYEGRRYARAANAMAEDHGAYIRMLDSQDKMEGVLFSFGEAASTMIEETINMTQALGKAAEDIRKIFQEPTRPKGPQGRRKPGSGSMVEDFSGAFRSLF